MSTSPIHRALLAELPQWVGPDATVLVATSGGPDSQALLHGLARCAPQLGLTLFAAGVDHGLRAEAASELKLAQELAAAHKVPFAVLEAQVPTTKNRMAQARQVRYRLLMRHARRVGAQAIAVAHTADDQVETVLFNLARGASLRGAAGIPPCRGRLVRPLLGVGRAEILSYLAAHGVAFATDPTNLKTCHMRGLVRQRIAPALKALNSNYAAHVGAFAASARADERLLAAWARRWLRRARTEKGALHLPTLQRAPRALWPRVLRLWLKPHGVTPLGRALPRLLAVVAAPGVPLQQGAMAGGTVSMRGEWLTVLPEHALPPRRAGT